MLVLGARPTAVKDPVGVYGVVDRVVFEPDATNPQRIQIWGVFAVAKTFEVRDAEILGIDLQSFRPARRGYLYYAVNANDVARTRQDWSRLSEAAGTGEPVAFGSRVPPAAPQRDQPQARMSLEDTAEAMRWERHNGRIRRAAEPAIDPDVFPLHTFGHASPSVATASQRAYQLLHVPEPLSPADGAEIAAGKASLVVRNVADRLVQYIFEIEDANGASTTSPPIPPGEAQTVWSPGIVLRPGRTYTWRVQVRSPDGTLQPPAESAFRVRH
jgi:hypothetical protein